MFDSPGLTVLVVGPLVLQFACYYGLIRFAFRVPSRRAASMAAARVAVGLFLFWSLVLVTLGAEPSVATLLAVSSPLAWAAVARMDPERSMGRALALVVAGTVLSFCVAEGYSRVFFEESTTTMDIDWD
jgi:hypothetical protein